MDGEYSCDEEDETLTSVSHIVSDEDRETSSQVARSVLSSLFNKTVDRVENETNLIKTSNIDVENVELEIPVVNDGSVDDVSLTGKLEDLTRSQHIFTSRINDWINTVTLLSEGETLQHDSPTGGEKEDNNNQIDDFSEEDEDDQPSATTSQVTTNSDKNNEDDISFEALDELKKKYKAESKSYVTSSIIPSNAFENFERGFSQVQLSNGNELFDNGTLRNRMFVDDLPKFSSWKEKVPNRNYHFCVSETTEHKMKMNNDGTYVYDKTYKKEKTEKIYDEGNNGGNFLFKCLTIILSLGMIFSVGVFITEHCQSVGVPEMAPKYDYN